MIEMIASGSIPLVSRSSWLREGKAQDEWWFSQEVLQTTVNDSHPLMKIDLAVTINHDLAVTLNRHV